MGEPGIHGEKHVKLQTELMIDPQTLTLAITPTCCVTMLPNPFSKIPLKFAKFVDGWINVKNQLSRCYCEVCSQQEYQSSMPGVVADGKPIRR